MEKEKILVTSALPYANGPIHIGHIAGAYLPADIYVRFNRMAGNDIIYICGSDEHGVPILIKSLKEKVTPKEIIDKYHSMNKEAFKKLGISFDNYSRTSLPVHHKTASDFFLKAYENGYLSEQKVEQLFCKTCNLFLADRYVEGTCSACGYEEAKGDQCEKCGEWLSPSDLTNPVCKICGSSNIELKATNHYFLKLKDFQKKVEEWFFSKKWKTNVHNYCKGWFDKGLEDRAITRDLDWGIKVPLKGYENKVLYVWFDAPIGYLSSTKEWAENTGDPDKWKEYWKNPECKMIHFVGKDNITFHAILWPLTLMAADDNYNLPYDIPANEYLNISSKKISTSKNFAIWVDDYLKNFEPDSLRYAIAWNMPENRDADFSWEYFQERHNNELADNVGNFVNRTMVFCKNYFDYKVPTPSVELAEIESIFNSEFITLNSLRSYRDRIAENIKNFRFKDATKTFMALAKESNRYFHEMKPWECRKDDNQRCADAIYISIQIIKNMAQIMAPIMPFSAKKIWSMLNLQGDVNQSDWNSIGIPDNLIPPGHKINEPAILFKKISLKNIEQENKKMADMIKEDQNMNIITIDDFSKVELKVAKIIQAEQIPKSKKLVKLQVETGETHRQIVAGIAEYYKPEELVNKKIIVVCNLKPAKLMGETSEGMLLAAKKGDKLTLVVPEHDIDEGAEVS